MAVPAVVLLDVNGTLTDPAPIGAVWGRPELGERVLELAVHSAMVCAFLGATEGQTLPDHLSAALDVVVAESALSQEPGLRDQARSAASGLPARPGAVEALSALRSAGVRLVALTNSGAEGGRATLAGNGLLPCLDDVLGVEAVGTFKPSPRVYEYALGSVGAPASQVMLMATHPWDLAGAAAVGLSTAFVRHGPRAWPAVYPTPTCAGDDLVATAEAILGRPSGILMA